MQLFARLLLGVLVALGLPAAPAAATNLTYATVTANTPIAVYHDWVVWSAHAADGWHLVASHGGHVGVLPGVPRPEPYDVDLGTDAHDHQVATFSRCIRTPTFDFVGRIQPWTGAGCRIKVQVLSTGREDTVAIPRRPGQSDTTPSMWHGRVAFARRDVRRHKDVAQVLLWSPGATRLRTLPHGAMPAHCTVSGGCKGATYRGAVQGLDLGAKVAAFLWWIDASGAGGHGGWEVRADRLSDGRSVLAGSGFLAEVCGEGEVDTAVPSPPAADGSHVWYSLRTAVCYRNSYSAIRFNARTGKGLIGTVARGTESLVKYGSAFYGLVAPQPADQVQPHCDAPGAPCLIQRLERPALTAALERPHSPF